LILTRLRDCFVGLDGRADAAVGGGAFYDRGGGSARAEPLDVSGYVGVEARIYPAEARYASQHDDWVSPSLSLQPELRWKLDADNTLTLIPFGRLDAHDDERTHWDLREANWLYNAGDWDLRVGLGKVFWGVAESRHLVDIVNQSDLVESQDEEDKLGQPMANLNLITDVGTWSAFVLPYFRERTYAGPCARPSAAVPRSGRIRGGDEERHVDYAALAGARRRLRHRPVHFHGTGCEPRLADGSAV
jgi:hypothetical protein